MSARFQPAVISAIDIGSPARGRLGWYINSPPEGGTDLVRLANLLSDGLSKGPCALGFEAPMYVPFGRPVAALTSARIGEGNRPWSAGGGAGALATGLAVVPHFLKLLRDKVPNATASLDWRNPPRLPGQLLFFEAFVSGAAKGTDHVDDARLAVLGFEQALPSLDAANRLQPEDCFGLLGAALLRTGWTTDLAILSSGVLVIAA